MKPYNARDLFAAGIIAFASVFKGSSEPTTKSFHNPLKNPAGSKNLRRWYKNKTGMRGTYEEALNWYKELK